MTKPAPGQTRRTVLRLAAVFAPLIWMLHVLWRRPALLVEGVNVPSLFGSAVMSVVVGFGFAFLVGLAWLNFRRWRAVVRPSWGKVISALVMTGLMPIAVFDWFPWLYGVLTLMGAFNADLSNVLLTVAIMVLWYIPSGLVISGITDRRWRVVAFASFWFTGYFGFVLAKGVLRFTL